MIANNQEQTLVDNVTQSSPVELRKSNKVKSNKKSKQSTESSPVETARALLSQICLPTTTYEDEIRMCDEIVARFGDAPVLLIRELVARSREQLREKKLRGRNRGSWQVSCNPRLLSRGGDEQEPGSSGSSSATTGFVRAAPAQVLLRL